MCFQKQNKKTKTKTKYKMNGKTFYTVARYLQAPEKQYKEKKEKELYSILLEVLGRSQWDFWPSIHFIPKLLKLNASLEKLTKLLKF